MTLRQRPIKRSTVEDDECDDPRIFQVLRHAGDGELGEDGVWKAQEIPIRGHSKFYSTQNIVRILLILTRLYREIYKGELRVADKIAGTRP